eukprot:TRINITY_DN3212_c0_g1_i4.p1 TRINITY_DN3212_c0_g1~~TRINITY_DN3212_c0_g1_i4.p1  ORF type:complete len:460 (+),score=51.91 TRINITY_DN3212_c0_g1_i4:132-1511(+)
MQFLQRSPKGSDKSFLSNVGSPFKWVMGAKSSEITNNIGSGDSASEHTGTPWKALKVAVSTQLDENDTANLQELCSTRQGKEDKEREQESEEDTASKDEGNVEELVSKKGLFSRVFFRKQVSDTVEDVPHSHGSSQQGENGAKSGRSNISFDDTNERLTINQSTASGNFAEYAQLTPSTPTLSDVNLNIDLLSEVNLGRKLGEGGCGMVFQGQWKGQPVAIKFLHQQLQVTYPKQEEEMFESELRFMTKINHPNIVRCYGACRTPPNRAIIMEYIDGTCLHRYIHGRSSIVKPINTAKIIKAVAKGLEVMHPEAIHRDIKPSNILLKKTGAVKITDFGLSGIREGSCIWTENCRGTPMYIAPEVYQKKRVTEKADIFSLGIVAWECVSKQKAWDGYGEAQIMYRVAELQERPVIPDSCPQELRDLIQQCWAHNPDQRPKATEVIELCHQMITKWQPPKA